MPADRQPTDRETSRRSLLRGAAVGGAALPLLAACGTQQQGQGSSSQRKAQGSGSQGGGSGSGGAGSGASGAGSGGSGHPLAKSRSVPVGGGKILTQQQVVLTQPSKGDIKCFSAVCTHAGCLVSQIGQGVILCPCHGSEFSIKDGSVVRGPATRPLPEIKVTVKGGTVERA